MAEYSTSTSYAVDDTKPDIIAHVFKKEGNALKDLTGATTIKFYMRDMNAGTTKIDGDATGNSLSDATAGEITRLIQADDNDTAGRYLGWFTYSIGGGTQTTTTFEVLVENAWERSFI